MLRGPSALEEVAHGVVDVVRPPLLSAFDQDKSAKTGALTVEAAVEHGLYERLLGVGLGVVAEDDLVRVQVDEQLAQVAILLLLPPHVLVERNGSRRGMIEHRGCVKGGQIVAEELARVNDVVADPDDQSGLGGGGCERVCQSLSLLSLFDLQPHGFAVSSYASSSGHPVSPESPAVGGTHPLLFDGTLGTRFEMETVRMKNSPIEIDVGQSDTESPVVSFPGDGEGDVDLLAKVRAQSLLPRSGVEGGEAGDGVWHGVVADELGEDALFRIGSLPGLGPVVANKQGIVGIALATVQDMGSERQRQGGCNKKKQQMSSCGAREQVRVPVFLWNTVEQVGCLRHEWWCKTGGGRRRGLGLGGLRSHGKVVVVLLLLLLLLPPLLLSFPSFLSVRARVQES